MIDFSQINFLPHQRLPHQLKKNRIFARQSLPLHHSVWQEYTIQQIHVLWMLLFNVYPIHVNYEIIFFVRKSFSFKFDCIISIRSIESNHLSEINRTNPLGMKGLMAKEFGNLINNLWSKKYNWTDGDQLRVCEIEIHWFIKIEFIFAEFSRQKTSRICR